MTSRSSLRLALTLMLGAGVAASPSPLAYAQTTEAALIEATPIRNFRLDTEQTRFGKLEFVGGLVLSSPNWLFGGLSSLRLRPNGRDLVMVLDTGHWMTGELQRDPQGRLSGIARAEITSMKNRRGEADQDKYEMDSEGVALRGKDVLVSFERLHRVDVYPGPDFVHARPARTIPTLIPDRELDDNGSFETLVIAPDASPLAGAAVVVTEASPDKAGNLPAAILDGPLKGRFSVRRHDAFNISDGVFLPSGDLLLLQRRFTLAAGIGMRVVRVRGSQIKPGAVVDGEILMDADMGEQIDNMEGIEVTAGPDGSTRLILVSDDNHSILQRTVMLEFRLSGEGL